MTLPLHTRSGAPGVLRGRRNVGPSLLLSNCSAVGGRRRSRPRNAAAAGSDASRHRVRGSANVS